MSSELSLGAAAIIVIVIVMKYGVKGLIKNKQLYPSLTFLVAFLVAGVVGFLVEDSTRNVIQHIIKNAVLWGSGAISSYDLVVEKLEKFLKPKQ